MEAEPLPVHVHHVGHIRHVWPHCGPLGGVGDGHWQHVSHGVPQHGAHGLAGSPVLSSVRRGHF